MNSQHSPSRRDQQKDSANSSPSGDQSEKKILFSNVTQFALWLDDELFALEQDYEAFVTRGSSKLDLEER